LNKWGFFPSVAIGWRVSQEDFIKNISQVSNLKLRASWGQTGNQAIRPYQSQSLLTTNYYPFNDQPQVAYLDYYGNLANKALKWETTTQTNMGFDLGLFDNRVRTNFDYYTKKTEELLQEVVLPFSTGFTLQLQNAGSIENRGFEFMTGVTVIDQEFKWDISANYSQNRNEITAIAPGYEQQFAPALGVGRMKFQPFIQKPGVPLGTIWGYQEDGIFQNEAELEAIKSQPNLAVGEIRYKDISGPEGKPDSVISEYDKVPIGDVNPDFIFGFNNNFSYRNFNLSVMLQGVIGNDVLNQTSMMISGLYDSKVNIREENYEERWTGEGTSTTQPQAVIGNGRTLVFSDRFVEDGSFVRVKNVRLSYNLQADKINTKLFDFAQVYLSATNLLTLTNYSGYDPEVSAFGQDPSRRGVDAGNYPMSRTYTLGLNLRF
jgi:TonB-linked SusC/RagA family outer membrane protein